MLISDFEAERMCGMKSHVRTDFIYMIICGSTDLSYPFNLKILVRDLRRWIYQMKAERLCGNS